jgi:hypothetical protein
MIFGNAPLVYDREKIDEIEKANLLFDDSNLLI